MTQSGEGDASEFARLARALGEAKGFEAQLELLVSEAVRLVPCRWASVAVSARLSAHPARLSTSSDLELGTTISRIAGRAGTSPGIDAFERGSTVHCPDLAADGPYPTYCEGMLAQTPVRSVLSAALVVHDTTIGVLSLYSDRPHAFDARALERARLLVEHAGLAVAAELGQDKADQLEVALQSSRLIGAAIGILTERLRIPTAHAFERLRAASQHSNRKLSDVASELVETGTLSGDLERFIRPS